MTVATLADVLQPAIVQRSAVAGLVVLGWEDARAYVEAADEAGLPVILQAGPGCRTYTPVSVLGKMFRVLAEQARVPVVCHIDHAYTVDECAIGIDSGFSSVMIDGSKLPIGENIAITARVVEMARRAGVSVEGEVGVVGYVSGGGSTMTSPDEAQRFDQESGVDALAISVGNVHLSTEKTTGIDLDLVRRIEAVTHSPLVLHGGSGIPPAIRRRLARETRVKKFNIGTELRMAFGAALRKSLADHPDVFDRLQLLGNTIAPLKAEARAVMSTLAEE
ncbi:MAG: class II fructose-bisphosphate aldolase [Alphaproteobacteria bacterium]|nr:class II fructose-bisphosphate aldolase [Alphaproteobacteria bacterium]